MKARPARAAILTVGADAGGTFTDFIDADGRTKKVPSNARRSGDVIATGVRALAAGRRVTAVKVVHGTTVATNAVLEGDLAPTGVLVTDGFRDVLALGRQNRPDLYASAPRRAFTPPSREFLFEIPERMDADGAVVRKLDEKAVRAAGKALIARGVETVAVCFLHSWANPAHERRAAEILERLGLIVTASAALVPEYREFERFSTAYVNAALRPKVAHYVHGLAEGFPALARDLDLKSPVELRLMHSSGGLVGAAEAASEPVRLVLSGPAGGLVGAFGAAGSARRRGLITFDMGGTSTDVALIDGALETVGATRIAGRPLLCPVLDVHTVGAGGGSIARRDSGGALSVGPASAGADPGPAAYGRGGPVTVTDANVFLGRLLPDRFLGGEMRLDRKASVRAIDALARFLRLSPTECALGIVAIAEVTTARAVRAISMERGHDPRRFALVAFGGAGPLHAVQVGARIGTEETVVPPNPGLLSAEGMLRARAAKEASRTVLGLSIDRLERAPDRVFDALENSVRAALQRDGVAGDVLVERSVDLRYRGQSYELNVALGGPGRTAAAFIRLHERRYGFLLPAEIEVVTVRVRAFGPPVRARKPKIRRAVRGVRPEEVVRATFEEGTMPTPVYDRTKLGAGFAAEGPAIIAEYSATTVVPPGARLSVESDGLLAIVHEGKGR